MKMLNESVVFINLCEGSNVWCSGREEHYHLYYKVQMLARQLGFLGGFRVCTCKIGVLLGVFGGVWRVHVRV